MNGEWGSEATHFLTELRESGSPQFKELKSFTYCIYMNHVPPKKSGLLLIVVGG